MPDVSARASCQRQLVVADKSLGVDRLSLMIEGELHGLASAAVCGFDELRELTAANRSNIEAFRTEISEANPIEALDANPGWDPGFGVNNGEWYLDRSANTPVLGIDQRFDDKRVMPGRHLFIWTPAKRVFSASWLDSAIDPRDADASPQLRGVGVLGYDEGDLWFSEHYFVADNVNTDGFHVFSSFFFIFCLSSRAE